jgi:hypothetical protein
MFSMPSTTYSASVPECAAEESLCLSEDLDGTVESAALKFGDAIGSAARDELCDTTTVLRRPGTYRTDALVVHSAAFIIPGSTLSLTAGPLGRSR